MESSPVDPADIRRRLMSAGERLGWQFRDRHRFWRHWTQPAPERRRPVDPQVHGLLAVGLILFATLLVLLTVGAWAYSAVGEANWPTVIAGWLLLAALTTGFVLLTRRTPKELHTALVAQWEHARDVHNAAERARVDAIDEWGAVRTMPGTRRIDVFGGEYQGWSAFLTTYGASLLAEQTPVVVLDLSHVNVSAGLCDLAAEAGVDMHVELLPDHIATSTLLSGLAPTDLKDVLIEAIDGEQGSARDDRVLDDRILTAICEQLGAGATPARIHEALKAAASTAAPDRERVQRLEAYLAHLAELRAAGPPTSARLTCFSITQQGSQLTTELLTDLLGQWLIRSLKNVPQGSSPRTVVVVGADRLRAHQLERVTTLGDALGFRLVLFFQHLRDTGSALLGGGRATVFMRLGNHEEAERAANFIGRGYRFELARITTEHGQSDTTARTNSRTGEILPWTRRWGSSRSRALATSWTYAETRHRVHELYVEPGQLQALAPTAFVLVQHLADQRVVAVAGDCDPDVLSLPRVSTEPLAEPGDAPPIAAPQRESLPRQTA